MPAIHDIESPKQKSLASLQQETITIASKDPINKNRSIIDILTNLLAIISVANSFFGLSKSLEIIFPLELFSCTIPSMSFCESENKATAAPESKEELNSKTAIPKRPNTRLVSTT